MKKIFILFVLLSGMLNAQSLFHKKIAIPGYPDFTVTDFSTCSDGGYIGCGQSQSFSPVIFKTDANGGIVWAKYVSSGDSNSLTLAHVVGECIGGGYYFLGEGTDYGNNITYFLVKLDATCNVLWSKKIPFSDNPYSTPIINQKPNGDFIIIPSVYSQSGIIVINSNGVFLWGLMFGDDPKCPSFSGLATSDGGFIISGKDNSDVFLVKLNATGIVQWASRYQDPNLYSQPRSIIQTQDGNYLISGLRTDYFSGLNGGFVMKINSNGNMLWHKTYAYANYDYYFNKAAELQNGDIVLISGNQYSYLPHISKIDQNGNLIYAKQIGTVDSLNYVFYNSIINIKTVSGNDLLFCGATLDNNLQLGFFIRTDASGNNFGCNVSDLSITVASLGNIPQATPTYTKTNVAPPVNGNVQVSNTSFSSEELCVTGIDEPSVNAISIVLYPNPAKTAAMLSLHFTTAPKNVSVFINDVLGRKVFARETIPVLSNSMEINLAVSNLQSGVYYVNVFAGDKSSIAKLVVQ